MQDARDRAALFALGCLRGEEARAFEAHLRDGCALCAAEVKACSQVTPQLGHAAVPVRPRAAVRARVLERIRATAGTPLGPSRTDGLLFLRAAQVPWQPAAASAVEFKLLFVDAQQGVSTQLVRMGAGATYPAHRHAGVEELYLLAGDLSVSGVEMHAGDYCRAEPGSVHDQINTRSGCLFISKSSLHDELLA